MDKNNTFNIRSKKKIHICQINSMYNKNVLKFVIKE